MSWQDQLKGDSLSWLLEANTPEVRYLALRDLLERPKADSELHAACKAAHKKGPIENILREMEKVGYWVEPGPGYNPKYRSTVWAIIRWHSWEPLWKKINALHGHVHIFWITP
jgi:hypothetical protein